MSQQQSTDAVKASPDYYPVHPRIGAGADAGMAESSYRRQEVYPGVAKPGSLSAQAGESRQDFPMLIEIVLPHTVQHNHQNGARATSR